MIGRTVGDLIARAREDIAVVFEKDPAATSVWEVLFYPHLHALWLHRLAHHFYRKGHRLGPRLIALYARFISGGIDIHPGATIGRRFFIDHGSGVVIGETTIIGDDVMLYHAVTLGATGWWKDMKRGRGAKRHPTVEDHVVIGTGATILGPITIGAYSKIGAQALVIESLPPHSIVLGHAGSIIHRSPDDTITTVEQPVDDWVV
jgi:serine O-acetyltransferase